MLGCATGEEAYSIAMLIHDFYLGQTHHPHTQIIATDINPTALEIARKGIYPRSNLRNLEPNYIQRYFDKVEDGYQCNATLRNMVLFANHNVVSRPSFTNVDVILCRNLIYLLKEDNYPQVLHKIHYALNQDSLLFLGHADRLGKCGKHFNTIDHQANLYTKNLDDIYPDETHSSQDLAQSDHVTLADILPLAHERTSLIVNSYHEIVYLHGDLTPYCHISADNLYLHLCEFTHSNLEQEIQQLLSYTQQYKYKTFQQFVRYEIKGEIKKLILHAKYYPTHESSSTFYVLLSFEPILSKHTTVENTNSSHHIISHPNLKNTQQYSLDIDNLDKTIDSLQRCLLEEQRAHKQAQQKLASIFEADSMGLSECTSDGTITTANTAVCSIFEADHPEQLIGNTICQFTTEEYSAHIQYSVSELSRYGSPSRFEVEIKTLKGNIRWVDINLVALPLEGQHAHDVLIIVVDQTERKQAQHLAMARQHELNRVMRTSAISEIASTLAHEISQPLAAITNYLRGCQNRIQNNIGSLNDLEGAISQAFTQVQRATNIIKHIKTFTQNDQSVELKPHSLNNIIHNTLNLMSSLNIYKNLKIELQLDNNLPHLQLNQTQIEQLFINLINNALRSSEKQNPNATQHNLIIMTRKLSAKEVQVQVKDFGIGLPNQENIFRPFFSETQGGMGIGLAICRSIVETHGGNIQACNNRDTQGATITFTLLISPDA